jgi:hypothetical protein
MPLDVDTACSLVQDNDRRGEAVRALVGGAGVSPARIWCRWQTRECQG